MFVYNRINYSSLNRVHKEDVSFYHNLNKEPYKTTNVSFDDLCDAISLSPLIIWSVSNVIFVSNSTFVMLGLVELWLSWGCDHQIDTISIKAYIPIQETAVSRPSLLSWKGHIRSKWFKPVN